MVGRTYTVFPCVEYQSTFPPPSAPHILAFLIYFKCFVILHTILTLPFLRVKKAREVFQSLFTARVFHLTVISLLVFFGVVKNSWESSGEKSRVPNRGIAHAPIFDLFPIPDLPLRWDKQGGEGDKLGKHPGYNPDPSLPQKIF